MKTKDSFHQKYMALGGSQWSRSLSMQETRSPIWEASEQPSPCAIQLMTLVLSPAVVATPQALCSVWPPPTEATKKHSASMHHNQAERAPTWRKVCVRAMKTPAEPKINTNKNVLHTHGNQRTVQMKITIFKMQITNKGNKKTPSEGQLCLSFTPVCHKSKC